MAIQNREENEIIHGKKLFESGAEQIWGWSTPAGKIRFQRRADWIIQQAKLGPGKRVLEIGCGTGNFTELFAVSRAHMVAVDISSVLIEQALKRNLPDNVEFVCNSFNNITSSDFDAVIGSSVLHHLEIEAALNHIFSQLKPGGFLAFGEPNMLNPQILIQKNISWIKERMGDSPDETAFFKNQMIKLLQKTGFENIQVIPLDWLHPAIPQAMIPITLRIESLLQKLPIVRGFAGSLYICAQKPE